MVTGATILWSSSNPASATVSNKGLVLALASGSSNITATSKGIDATATLTVSKNDTSVVRTVTVIPELLVIIVGDAQQLKAVVADSDGNEITVDRVSWLSSDDFVATIS